jgi:putative Mg2+ transporter-C (MgtC) family protein
LVTYTPPGEIALRLVLALILGAAVGLEREAQDKPAGLRTYMLVSLASATFMLLALEMMQFSDEMSDAARLDPIRVMEAVVTGVAFLGAGTIIQSRSGIRGITTGAGMWLAGAIGLACGLASFLIAVMVAALSVIVLLIVGHLERRVKDNQETEDDSEGRRPSRKS